MSETTNTPATETTSETPKAKDNRGVKRTPQPLIADLEAAKAAKPSDPIEKDRKLFKLMKGGEVIAYHWGRGPWETLLEAAKKDGYTSELLESKTGGPITKDKIASALDRMDDAERAILLQKYLPTTPAPAPTTTKGGKGRK